MKYKTYWRQIGRTLTHNLGRLLAIMGIVALGAGFLAGLSASSPIMKETADRYYGENRYMDFQLLSTMGMTEEDIEAIRAVEGIQTVDPGYRLDVMATIRGKDGERTIRFLMECATLQTKTTLQAPPVSPTPFWCSFV